jgi:predicted DNA-binding transcriptional regulator AlpA
LAEDQDLLARPEVIRETTLSGPSLWRRVKDGTFPPPLKIGPNRVAWLRSDVDKWKANLRRTDGSTRESVCLGSEGS